MFVLLTTLWVIWEIKAILFWLYLWQLKDYHIGRFADHFRTENGKKIALNYIQIAKVALFVLIIIVPSLFYYLFSAVFLLYLVEGIFFLRAIVKGGTKKPVWTAKTLFLWTVCLGLLILLFSQIIKTNEALHPAIFLFFDIITPVIVSFVVLFFQPAFVLFRKISLRKAKSRLEKMKNLNGVKVVAITGSYGKTSTKEFLSTILSSKFKVLKTKEHQNSEIGVAKCILKDLKTEHQIFIAEVGAYNKGKVKEVCNMLKPKFGLVAGVNEQHLALFGSMENLLSAEGGGELASILPQDGVLILNGDNKHCLNLYKKSDNPSTKKIYTMYKGSVSADIWAEGIEVSKEKISFIANDKSGNLAHFDVKVLGKQNVQNLLGAILMAKELGMNFGEIADACEKITLKQGGMTLNKEKHGLYIIDSSYSSNPDGAHADLEYLSNFEGKKAIVMPCLIELGEKSSEVHRKIGNKIAKTCNLAIITTKDKFKEIKEGAMESGMEEKNIIFSQNPNDIYATLTLLLKSNDAVLLEGRVPNRLVNLLMTKNANELL